ncbi:hypothetical protein BDR05DRAFT_946671 [Suillus weaverae]|nr:hypothetical protein BDR05DRAFT_946671 [Suillus weaverae]
MLSSVLGGLPSQDIQPNDIFSMFSSPTAGLLFCWQYSGINSKSSTEMKHLARTFLNDDNYWREDAQTYDDICEKRLLGDYLKDKSNPFHVENGWCCSSDSVTSTFHMTPFQQLWKVSEEHTVNVYSKAYSSPAFLEAYKEINTLPRDPDDDLECVVASLMMWSDATHLASFSNASLWPIYLLFGNQSKYTRGKPTASACHHVAYIPTITFKTFTSIFLVRPLQTIPILIAYKYGVII